MASNRFLRPRLSGGVVEARRDAGAGLGDPIVDFAVAADVVGPLEFLGQRELLRERPLRVGDAHTVGGVDGDQNAAGNSLAPATGLAGIE